MVLLLGCAKRFEFASWEVDTLTPLIKGKLNLANAIDIKEVNSSGDGILHVNISDTLLRLGLDSLIGIPDTTLTSEFSVPVGGIQWPPGVPFYRDTIRTRFNLKDVALTYAEVRRSLFTVELKNNLKEPILVRYKILSATKNGDTFTLEEAVPKKGTFLGEYDLDGYELDLRGADGTRVNTIYAYVEAWIDPSITTTYTFSAGESFNIENTFEEIVPSYATGFFGQQSTSYADTSEVNLFQSIGFQSADIVDFDVSFTIDNGIGADLLLTIKELSSFSDAENRALEHTIIGQDQMFSRAIDLSDPSDPVKHIRKKVQFTPENSNLDELLEIHPNGVHYAVDLQVNPLGNVSLGNDFVYYGHDISAYMDLDIPLKLGFEGLTLSDTFDFRVDTSAFSENLIQSGSIHGYIENGYPFSAAFQLYFLDSNAVIIDSLSPDLQTVLAAVVDGFGNVSSTTASEISFPFNAEKIGMLKRAQSSIVAAKFDTYNAQVVTIRDDYAIDFKFVADLKVLTP
ncbi:MAG: hypothetical protein RLP15_13365 [Cryomorphaceae bacterium]